MFNTCAIGADESVYCWGQNNYGELGLGDNTHRRFPTRLNVFQPSQIVEIQAGYSDRMTAIRSTRNTIYWWGRAMSGANRSTPVAVGGSGAQSVSSGQTICIARGGYTYCMGDHSYGRTGRGLTSGSDYSLSYSSSERVKASANVYRAGLVSLRGGGNFTCGHTAGGSMYCWGWNLNGALGRGSNSSNASYGAYATSVRIASGRSSVPLTGVNEMGLGLEHACASRTNPQSLYCWGDGQHGRLGTGGTTDRYYATLVNVPGIAQGEGFRSLGAGSVHTCGVTDRGRVFCWGSNSQGQIGVGEGVSTVLRPQEIHGVPGRAVAISVGAFHSCALNSDYEMYCWGHNEYGQIGDGSPTGNGAKVYRPARVLDLP
jgi:alpha-tubulin suppressor-like RCC1 family protein